MRIIVTLSALVAVIGCGSGGDKASAGDQACQDLTAKLASCNLTVQGTCNATDPCTVECAVKADCDQLKAGAPSGSYLQCVTVCSGGSTDDFVCKDGAHFVKAAQRCDGRPACPDGSDEMDCDVSAGSGGASGGPGGSSASGGSSGASGGGSGGTSVSPECEAMAAHEVAACPTADRVNVIRACTGGASLYGPEGCGGAWKAYVDCAAKAPFDCEKGPSGCDAQRSGYLGCQSQFVGRTGCTRLEGQDDQCPAATPYSFGCLSSVPAACVPAPGGGSSATFACCPAFPAP